MNSDVFFAILFCLLELGTLFLHRRMLQKVVLEHRLTDDNEDLKYRRILAICTWGIYSLITTEDISNILQSLGINTPIIFIVQSIWVLLTLCIITVGFRQQENSNNKER